MYSHVKQSSSSFWDALSDFLSVSIRNINKVYPKAGHFLKIIKINFDRFLCRPQFKSWSAKACLSHVLSLQRPKNKQQTVNVKLWTVNGRTGRHGQRLVEWELEQDTSKVASSLFAVKLDSR